MAEQANGMSRRRLLTAAGAGAGIVGLGLAGAAPAAAENAGAQGGPLFEPKADADQTAAAASTPVPTAYRFVHAANHTVVSNNATAASVSFTPAPLNGAYLTSTGATFTTSLAIPPGARLAEVRFVFAIDPSATGSGITAMAGDLHPFSDAAVVTDYMQTTTGTGDVELVWTPSPALAPDDATSAYIATVSGTTSLKTYRGLRIGWVPAATGIVAVTPSRVYDSRSGGGKLAPDADRVVSVATGPSGTVVPVGATAVAITLTITGTEGGGGFVAAFAGDETYAGTSSINWFGPNQNLAATAIVPLSVARTIKLRAGIAKTDVVVDVTGYLI